MRRSAEIGILGAVPARALASELLAAQRASVMLFDPKAPWEKPCGGGLTPAAIDEMPELEELLPSTRAIHQVSVEVSPTPFVARTVT